MIEDNIPLKTKIKNPHKLKKLESLNEEELKEYLEAWKKGDRKRLLGILDNFENRNKKGD